MRIVNIRELSCALNTEIPLHLLHLSPFFSLLKWFLMNPSSLPLHVTYVSMRGSRQKVAPPFGCHAVHMLKSWGVAQYKAHGFNPRDHKKEKKKKRKPLGTSNTQFVISCIQIFKNMPRYL